MQALSLLKRAEERIGSTNSELDKARIQINLGTYHIARNDWSIAKAHFDSADGYLQDSADLYLQALVHNNLGAALTELDQLQEAETQLQLAIICWGNLIINTCLPSHSVALLKSKREQVKLAKQTICTIKPLERWLSCPQIQVLVSRFNA